MTEAIDVLAENVRKIDLTVDGHTNDVAYRQEMPQRKKEYAYNWWPKSEEYQLFFKVE